MTIALRPAPTMTAAPPAGGIERAELFASFAAAEPHWRALEHGDTLKTPYQAFNFAEAWQRHIGGPLGVEPFLIVGFDRLGTPLCLWPLGRRTVAGTRIVEFLGGKHTNFNLCLWRRDIAARIEAKDIDVVLRAVAGQADALVFMHQPKIWQGVQNPLLHLPHAPSSSLGHSGTLGPDFDAILRARTNADTRKKMRKKQERLAQAGAVRFARAGTPAEKRRVLDAFFAQKQARMRSLGMPDVFGDPDVQHFIEALTFEPAGGAAIELYSLSVDDLIVATKGGISDGGRFYAMFNSMIMDRHSAESPGEQLIVHLVRDLCQRGFSAFDLGTGEARYKNLFCPDEEPLFDSFVPLTGAGRAFVIASRFAASAKRLIKSTPGTWALLKSLRRLRGRLA